MRGCMRCRRGITGDWRQYGLPLISYLALNIVIDSLSLPFRDRVIIRNFVKENTKSVRQKKKV